MKIDCIICKNELLLPKLLNTDKYSGHVYCSQCSHLIQIKLNKGKIEEYKIREKIPEKITNFADLIRKSVAEELKEK